MAMKNREASSSKAAYRGTCDDGDARVANFPPLKGKKIGDVAILFTLHADLLRSCCYERHHRHHRHYPRPGRFLGVTLLLFFSSQYVGCSSPFPVANTYDEGDELTPYEHEFNGR